MSAGRHSVRFATALAALTLVATLGGYARPPIVAADTGPFTDIVGTTFEADIDWLYAEGITVGCGPTLFCPADPVSRGQMASFLARMFDLPATTTDYFSDDDGTTHETDINRLAAADITMGCTETTFCPAAPVLRGQMASFLARAIPLTTGAGNNYFRDDDGTTHEPDIDRAAAAGITTGCGTWRYCPASAVTRGQMAGFLHREETPVTPPPYPAPSGPQTLHVAIDGDDTANDCFTEANPCRTIRYAIAAAIDGDTIAVGPGVFGERGLRVDRDVQIRGAARATTIVDAGNVDGVRVLTILASADVSIRDVTLRNGGGSDSGYLDGGAVWNGGTLELIDVAVRSSHARRGGGVFNVGTLSLAGTFVSGNAAEWGGGVFNFGALSMTGSTVERNRADDGAGGIHTTESLTISASSVSYNSAGRGGAGGIGAMTEPLFIIASAVTGNAADGVGGGVSGQRVSISGSTVNGNSATFGGGIRAGHVNIEHSAIVDNTASSNGGGICAHFVEVANSTISGNRASAIGGGIWGQCGSTGGDAASIKNSTIAGNRASTGAGIAGGQGPIELRNALVVGNVATDGSELTQPSEWIEKLNSIVGIPAGLTLADILDPAGLADNGGPTQTIALTDSPTNPAIDTGHAATCAAAPVSGLDQRGLPRTPPCDIGAYELQP